MRSLRILIQSNGAALLLSGHAALVAASEADGAHLTGIENFQAAAPALKPARIAGCGGLTTRHDAMLAGESGADYVMFGEPDRNGRRPGFDAVCERVAWWADVLTIPCVGYAARPGRGRGARARRCRLRRDRSRGLAKCARRRDGDCRRDGAPCNRGAGTMMRRLLVSGAAIAALLAAGGAHAQAPLQITPPTARPPASIPTQAGAKAESRKAAAEEIDRRARGAQICAAKVRPGRHRRRAHSRPKPFRLRRSRRRPRSCPPSQQAALQPQPAPGAQGDVAFGAFQRGYYVEAFKEASRRASEQGDPVAMTLIGELYANGYGVAKDEKKALAWFSLAADRGDRQAIFALAMFRFAGRGGPQDQAEAAALLDKAAKLGHVAAGYNLALLYLEGQQVRQDIARAAELLRGAADAGSPEAQYALATLYKEGNGIAKDPAAAARLLGAAARSGNVAAEVEYAIALFNGTGIQKDENAAAALFRKAALKGNAVAQNRFARILATGRGLSADPVAATKWHTIAKAGGASDIWLEDFMQTIKPTERAAGENAARLWLAHAAAAG